ncbi:MAG: response regulator transcription factor [Anaerolineae bacterium]|nr:response regulator transcription factor [Anaerolineae bacterium]
MKPISVLMVDDNPTFLNIAARFLAGHQDIVVIDTLNEGARVLQRAQERSPDVVLVDLSMPDVPGLTVIAQLRHALPGVGIIALTLLGADSYRQAAMNAGADAFIPKSALCAELVPAIRAVHTYDHALPSPPANVPRDPYPMVPR